jgi:hypothetical protein
MFLLKFLYQENLPNQYILWTRGTRGKAGFFEVSLLKEGKGRVIVIDAENDINSAKPAIFKSTSELLPNTEYIIMTGVAQNIGGDLTAIYTDSNGANNFQTIKQNASFDFTPQDIYAFRQTADNSQFNGFVQANRMIIFDSASPAVNYVNVHTLPSVSNII